MRLCEWHIPRWIPHTLRYSYGPPSRGAGMHPRILYKVTIYENVNYLKTSSVKTVSKIQLILLINNEWMNSFGEYGKIKGCASGVGADRNTRTTQ